MNNVQSAFAGQKALVAYLMAGDPTLEKTADYVLALQDAGVDLIELGIPFSDPIAEGEVIQRASQRALQSGTTVDKIFAMLEGLAGQIRVPLVFMTYINVVFHYGYDSFFSRCAACGVRGVILPDAPFEEQGEVTEAAAQHGVDSISLVAPTSQARVAQIAASAQGFVYLVSSMGVTGVRSEITTDLAPLVAAVRAATDLPVAVGFGISTPEQAARYSALADGVIVGSAIVHLIEQHAEAADGPLRDYARSLKEAIAAVV